MTDLPEPTTVNRHTPTVAWRLEGPPGWSTIFVTRRQGQNGEILDISDGRNVLKVKHEFAAKLGAAITAAAAWTDEPIVDAEIIDDRPRLDHQQLLVDAVVGLRPQWMTEGAARTLGRSLVHYLRHYSPAQDGEELTP